METMTVLDTSVRRTAAIDILLVGGRPTFRERLRKLLDSEPGFTVAGETSNAAQALKAMPDVRPDVVIVIPSGGPLARTMRALQKLTTGGNRARTILLTSTFAKTNIAQAQALGFSAILSKATSPSMLIGSVRSVAAGDCWLGRKPVEYVAGSSRPRQLSPVPKDRFGLTRREMEVVEAVVRSYLTSLN